MRKADEIYPVGTRVCKKSGNDFKSRLYINTIKGVVKHPYKLDKETGVGVPAYTFVEDDSVVEAAAVVVFKKIENKEVAKKIREKMKKRGEVFIE